MTLPNLFIPGAGKSGTSSLHLYLAQHPDIYMCQEKEPNFFGNDDTFQKGLEWYAALFEPGSNRKFRGESSTGYMVFSMAAVRISRFIPDPHFIFVLRNPIDRVWSHYRWLWALRSETRPLREAVLADCDAVPDYRESVGGNYRYYLGESSYGHHVGRFFDMFGPERILVLVAEELFLDPNRSLQRCASFLGIEPFAVSQALRENATPPPRFRRAYALLSGQPARSPRMNALRGKLHPATQTLLRQPAVRALHSMALNQLVRRGGAQPELSPSDRAWLRSNLIDDVAQLRRRTGMLFREWEQDFPLEEKEPTVLECQ